jgi:putative redox protein
MRIELKRKNQAFHFEAFNEEGQMVNMDSSPDIGGENKGVRPSQLLPMALGGCSAIDVILILQKQKQELEDIQISIDAERETGQTANTFISFHIIYKLKGNIDKGKAERAVALSMEKYCSVARTLSKTAKITWEVDLTGPSPALP